MTTNRRTMICCLLFACVNPAAVAAPSYRFAFDRANYNVALCEPVNVTVYP
jgi:hypothetical protein